MRDLLRLICMAVVLLTFTQCGKDSEPEPEPEAVTETWQLTYNDYHLFMNANSDEYRNLTHNVTIVNKGDELTFIGLFPEYPESSIRGESNGYTVSIPDAQIIDINGNDTVYFHCGYVDFIYYYWISKNEEGMHIDFKPGSGKNIAFRIQNDGRKMIATANQFDNGNRAFWISSEKDGHISFNSPTDLPNFPNMFEMELIKVSDSDK